jgi:hypothetical protein
MKYIEDRAREVLEVMVKRGIVTSEEAENQTYRKLLFCSARLRNRNRLEIPSYRRGQA